MSRRTAPLGRILKNDYFSLLTLFGVVGVWLLPVGLEVMNRVEGRASASDATVFKALLGVAIVLSPFCAWFAHRRIRSIRRVIESGHEVQGRIASVWFHRDRGRVEYDYQVGGRSYHAGNGIWKHAATERLAEGQAVKLIVDPAQPAVAYLADLYVG